MGILSRTSLAIAGAIIAVACIFVATGVDKACADPGDEWVFGADAPVAIGRDFSQFRPVVSGDHVFWEDNRPGAGSQSFTRIFYRYRGDPEGIEKPLTPGADYFQEDLVKGQFDPSVDGTIVAWGEVVPTATGARGYEIRYLDFGDGCLERSDCAVKRVPLVAAHELEPVVSGTFILWQDERHGVTEADILMFDTAGGSVMPLCDLPGQQKQHDADGEWVVWVDNRDGEIIRGRATNNDIYIKNINTGEERKVTNDGGQALQEQPAISGDLVVYTDYSEDATRGNIVSYRISTGLKETLYAGEGFDLRPDIDGGIVVWEACPAAGIDKCGIWMHDLETGISQPVSDGPRDGSGVNASNASLPRVDGASGRIVWQDDRDGGRAIYENRPGERARVLAERYRPELRLAAGEHFQPEPFQLMLELPGTFLRRWPNSSAVPVRNPGLADLEACAETDCYIDMMGSAIESGGGESSCGIDRGLVFRTYVEPYRAREGDHPPTVHARVKAFGGHTVIQYWMHYVANDHPQLFHEGDWEMVQVRLDERLRPYRADYSQHGTGLWRLWEGIEKGGHGSLGPVVYVAAGSHASYFRAGEYNLVPLVSRDVADGGGETVVPEVRMIPERELAGGAYSWLRFPGLWGERTDARLCLPDVPGIFSSLGHRDGPPGPAFQGAKWDDPLSWLDDSRCDGCEQPRGDSAVLGVSAWFGVEFRLYDAAGNLLGPDASGGFNGYSGAELLAYEELGKTVLQVAGIDIDAGYRIEMWGAPAGAITITLPDSDAGVVHTLEYLPYAEEPTTVAWLTVDGSRDFRLSVDTTGDGTADFEVEPVAGPTIPVDLVPPAPVTDLVATATGTGTIALLFSAPGDDGLEGSAAVYDVRYSAAPIDAISWHQATPFTPSAAPAAAGAAENVTVDGLAAGTTYYFAVRALDDFAGQGALSNGAAATTHSPELAWYQRRAYWASYADYSERSLSVDYEMRNKGTATAVGARVEASLGVPSSFFAITPLPLMVGDIEADTGRMVTIRYHAPEAASSFIAKTHASCRDSDGGEYRFPGPVIQTAAG